MENRTKALNAIKNGEFDVCIIGGGATGAGSALDAQLRGLRTMLIDAGDFSASTSSASTKLVHGGVRYLQQAVAHFDAGQYQMVKKALHERILMLRNAPFLTRPLELLVPCYSHFEAAYFTVGMKMYDWISGSASLFPSHYLSKAESLARMPTLKRDHLTGAVSYADGQFDDSRYGLTLLQTFVEEGGTLLNYAKLTGFSKTGEGKLVAAAAEDQLTKQSFPIRAKRFLNCTGPFSDHIRQSANPELSPRLRVSKGIHILLPLDVINSTSALLIPKTEDGRVIFAIPWRGWLLVGTTEDEARAGDKMVVTQQEIAYLLQYLRRYLDISVSPDDVCGGFAGLRPLVASNNSQSTEKLIRDHEVEVDATSGLISVLGGKWTTYRAMAEDGINHIQESLGLPVGSCKTHDHPLSGSNGFSANYWQTLTKSFPISRGSAHHLAEKYGTNATRVLELTKEDPGLLKPIIPGATPIRAEIVYGVRHEMATSIADILGRRIGAEFYGWINAIQAAPLVGEYLAGEFGWTDTQTRQSITSYIQNIEDLMHCAGIHSHQQVA